MLLDVKIGGVGGSQTLHEDTKIILRMEKSILSIYISLKTESVEM